MSGFNPVPFSTGSLQYTKKDLPQVSRMIMSTLSPSSVRNASHSAYRHITLQFLSS